MAQCPKWNAIVLKFLHHLKAHTLPDSTRFQQNPQPFAHTSVAWQTQAQHLLPVHEVLLVLIGTLPIWLKVTKINHTVKKSGHRVSQFAGQRPMHRTRKLLWSHTRTEKSNTLWWYSLHELQISITIALTDNQRQHKTVAVHCLTQFTHPVACGELKNQYRGFEDIWQT
jgi:hypothetical protein